MSLVANLAPTINSGFINTVNDAVDGDATATQYINAGYSAGQLGKIFAFDDTNIQQIQQPSVGVVFGGLFQYVKLAANAGAVTPGQLLFWNLPDFLSGATPLFNIYEVTTNEVPSGTDSAMQIAGVCLNSTWTPGNFAFVQIWGRVFVKFRAALTSAGAINGPVYAAAAGGADMGYADVINSANPTLFSDVQLLQGRYLGRQIVAATNGGLTQVSMALESRMA